MERTTNKVTSITSVVYNDSTKTKTTTTTDKQKQLELHRVKVARLRVLALK